MNEDNIASPTVHHQENEMAHNPYSMPEPEIKQPEAPAAPTPPEPKKDDQPMAVVKMYSTRGVEYAMLSIALWLLAGSLIAAIIALANGESSMSTLATPLSLMIVCFPVFAFFFLRTKKAEMANPDIKNDPSRRRFIQITQLVAFITLLTNTIVFVYDLLHKATGSEGQSIGKSLINLAVVTVVAGGVFAYYWLEEHKLGK